MDHRKYQDHGTDLQQKSPSSPTQQQSVKCETLHQKYFETVAYAAAAAAPKPPGSPVEVQDVNQSAPAPPTPPTSTSPTRADLSAPADSPESNKPSIPQTAHQSCDRESVPSTSVADLKNKKSNPPVTKKLPRTSKSSRQRPVRKPLETSFPVEPLIVVDTSRKPVSSTSIAAPHLDRIKKKGIKTTPLIKTTLRTTAGKPKSPLVARVARPAVAIKTTVGVDKKLACITEKPKPIREKSKEACVKPKVSSVKPKVSSVKPKVSINGQTANEKSKTSIKLKEASEKSNVTCNKPKQDSDKLEISCEKLKVQCEKPEESFEEPEVASEKPTDSSEKIEEADIKVKDDCLIESVTCSLVTEIIVEKEEDNPEVVTEGETKDQEVRDEKCKDCNCESSVIGESVVGPDLKEYIGFCYIRDKSNLDENDSVRVNCDTDSINTLTDPIDEDFCTQYSEADSDDHFCDSKETAESDSKEIGDNSLISNDSADIKTDSALDIDEDFEDLSEELGSDKTSDIESEKLDFKDSKPETRETRLNRIKVKSASLTRKSHDDPGFPLDQGRPGLKESGSRLSILRNWNDNLRSLYNRNRSFDSENSSYASFYSIDNGNTDTPLGSKSRRLKWTPRILSESRFSSTNSGTFSDCASFYTADTFGTFYSARSFQLDSCDNFQTCEDFQKYDLTPQSKLSKAKEALQRGKDFVKSKFENYRKRLPVLRKSDQGEESGEARFKSLCHRSCGFSCVHLGKEISSYSLPDFSAGKGDNPGAVEGGEVTELSCDKPPEVQDDAGACSVVPEDPAVTEEMDAKRTAGNPAGGGEPEKKNGSPTSSNSGNADPGRGNPGNSNLSNGKPGNSNGHSNSRTVKMETVVRGTTEGEEDDMPAGTEAISIPRSHKTSENGDSDDRPASKRLRWVSAVERTQGTSITSSLTSNNSVDQLLHQREMDPETLLNNLGFGADPNTDDSLNRIPERFVSNPCAARGINLQQFLVNHPELHHLLPMLDRTGPSADSSCGNSIHSGSENQSAPLLKKGSMQRQHTFSGVLHGMRFMREVQSPVSPPVPDEEDQKITQLKSVLDFQNRKALAQQGFYGNEFLRKTEDIPEEAPVSKTMTRSLSAAQRRKQFHHSCKSRSKNWSFTEECDGEKVEKEETIPVPLHRVLDSFDKGLRLRSFSDRFSSDSSIESADSYEENVKRQLIKQNSISNLRKQYQETIRQSMDGEFPVFDDMNNNNETESGRKLSISEVRKKQVDRLMASEEDDGDYLASTLQSSLKDTHLSVLSAQNSTHSTITGSPLSSKDLKFSFEGGLHDGESEFGFSSEHKTSQDEQSNISVIVEEEPRAILRLPSEEEEVTQTVSNPNELELPALVLRSDSCNTLVSQDTAEAEHLEGELTPRPGEIMAGVASHDEVFISKRISGDELSESTGSSGTLFTGQDKLEGPLDEGSSMEPGDQTSLGPSMVTKDTLKPSLACPPQESFELEEISSAEDMNGSNLPKSQGKRGPLEKSASTHSDSSGFADLDTIGETTVSSISDIPKDTFTSSSAKPLLTKQRTLGRENQNLVTPSSITNGYHDNRTTTSDPASLHQTEAIDRQVLVEKHRHLMDQLMSPAIEETKTLYACGRNLTKPCDNEEDKENENPELESITYRSDNQEEKSIVYTVNVPQVENQIENKHQLKVPKRYVSKVKMQVLLSKDSGDSLSTISDRSENSRIVQLGDVEHAVLASEHGEVVAEPESIVGETSLHAEIQQAESLTHKAFQSSAETVIPGHKEMARQSLDVKAEIRNKQKAKEALIKASTADWLLSNQNQSVDRRSGESLIIQPTWHHNLGRPIWASTPDLKQQPRDLPEPNKQKFPRLKEASVSHSFDARVMEHDEDNFHQNEELFRGGNPDTSWSRKKSRRPLTHHHSADSSFDGQAPGLGDQFRPGSRMSSSDESVGFARYSTVESSIGMPEDHMHYLKLARLVNGPSLVMSFDTKMPITRYTPNIKMKNWVDIPRNSHLEEETRLMQYAVQRYKVELSVMETMLTTMYDQVQQDIGHEEREEVAELQRLWQDVRREVDKMEVLLTDRLHALRAGNDSYSPLDALQIVQAMIDLLREQLYHQQMCISKDSRVHGNHTDDLISTTSSNGTTSSALLSDLSQQVSEVKETVSRSQEMQKQQLQETFSELKSSLLAEVMGELSTSSNSKMLQLQLQARDNEIQRLRMELLLQSVESGNTRKKLLLESDV